MRIGKPLRMIFVEPLKVPVCKPDEDPLRESALKGPEPKLEPEEVPRYFTEADPVG
jgi:hypothetical protein